MPVKPVPIYKGRLPVLTSGYGPRTGGMTSFHHGADFFYRWQPGDPTSKPDSLSDRWHVPSGEIPALAYESGVVSRSGWTRTGDRVRLEHRNGLATGYMHLRNRLVKEGDTVKAGQPIGTISFNPWCRGCRDSLPPPFPPAAVTLNHLHWEVYKNGKAVDPRPYWDAGELSEIPFSYTVGPFLTKVGITTGLAYVTYRLVFKKIG